MRRNRPSPFSSIISLPSRSEVPTPLISPMTNSCTASAYAVSTTCTISVAFTASAVAVGPRSVTIAVPDDAPGSEQIIQLGGLAQTAPKPITAGSAATAEESIRRSPELTGSAAPLDRQSRCSLVSCCNWGDMGPRFHLRPASPRLFST